MKRLVPGVGYDLYETADAVSLVIQDQKQEQEPDQFQVSVEEADGYFWFSIVPGYCTVQDHITRIIADGAGNVLVGDTTINDGELGINVLYKVDTCNAYGAKRISAASNSLTQNSFRPDTAEDNDVVIFLYRSTPGAGTPKLGVMKWTTFANYFRDDGTGAGFATAQPNYGAPAGIRVRMQINTGTVSGSTVVTGVGMITTWDKLGLHVQMLAHFDTTTKVLTQYKKGHVRMTDTAETVATFDSYSTTDLTENEGWHSYYYTTAGAGAMTGLTFA